MSGQSLFYQRLKEQIKLKEKSFNEVERELGYPRNSLNNYKSSIEPSGKRLVELADYFNTSPGYLLGVKKEIENSSFKEKFSHLDFEQKRELYEICQIWAATQLLKRYQNKE